MAIHTLYAYVDGYDLEEVQTQILQALTTFVAGRKWSRKTTVVNERELPNSNDTPGDLPRWDLGLTHELPDRGNEVSGWFDEVEIIAVFLGILSKNSGRQFVIGMADNGTGVTTDLLLVATPDVDLVKLRKAVGV